MRLPLLRRPQTHRDVVLRPPATAMVWLGEGQPHETVAVPGVALATGDVLVAVEMSTICGSDVHTVHGRRSAPVPLVLGHESVGRVIAVGDDGASAVDGAPVRVGDRIVWSVAVTCGTCDRCAAGLTQKCRTLSKYGHERIGSHRELTGGFASHVQLRAGTAIVRVPESLPAQALAPAGCATATAWSAVARAGRDRDLRGVRVRVYGAGLVGLSAAAIATAQGAAVEVRDPHAGRAALAASFGASGLDREPDVVIEASGHAVSDALDTVAIGGTVVLIGSVFPAPPVPLDAETVVRRMITITGVHNYTAADLAAAVDFLGSAGRDYPFADMVGRVRALTDLDEALDDASAPDAPLRVGLVAR